MKPGFAKYLILLIFLHVVLSKSSPGCPFYTWQCNNGQCIKFEDLCDGNYDCDDRSDETVEECLLRPCPSYAFQCAYGACITGKFQCNGIVNCVDGSDETKYLCQPKLNYEKEMQGKCGIPNSMECKSGGCINSERLCDGKNDCHDGSDETVEVCSFLKCPEYSFRCGYGACVTGSSVCDGIKDCRDGSDEIASLCSNITSTSITVTLMPQITTTTSIPTIYPASSERPSTSANQCSPTTLLRGISTVASCYYNNKPTSCYQGIRAGTIANVTCVPGYVEKETKQIHTTTRCDADGEWTRPKRKCLPECGTLSVEQQKSASKPWDVTILRRDYAPIYIPICSGVIVSPKVVLTAANCFLSYNNAYYTDHVFYNLVEGFYNKSYNNDDRLSINVHNVSSISIKNVHRTQDLAVLVLVNFFQFTPNLKPICLPTAQSNVFPFYNEPQLNIGRPIVRDISRVYLEYLIASVDDKNNDRKTLTYVNIYHFIPFIHREIKKYEYLL